MVLNALDDLRKHKSISYLSALSVFMPQLHFVCCHMADYYVKTGACVWGPKSYVPTKRGQEGRGDRIDPIIFVKMKTDVQVFKCQIIAVSNCTMQIFLYTLSDFEIASSCFTQGYETLVEDTCKL